MLHVSFVQTDTNKVGCCCVHVGDGVEMDTTTPNIQQQHAAGVPTHVTSNNVGSCWPTMFIVRLHGALWFNFILQV